MNKENYNDNINYKILMIGNSYVGKTYFLKKLTSEYNILNNTSYMTTIGVDCETLKLENLDVIGKDNKKSSKNFVIKIWDTAGQERFKSINKNYYSGANCIILMYEITNRKSFEDIEDWITSIEEILGKTKENESNYLVALIGNKRDLVNDSMNQNIVRKEEAKKKCDDLGLIFCGEISAFKDSKEDLINIIKNLTKEIYSKVDYTQVFKQKCLIVSQIKEKSKKKNCCLLSVA